MHTTDYTETFILVAPSTTATAGTAPPERPRPTVAWLAYAMLHGKPYVHTSDQVLFGVFAQRQGIAADELEAARRAFFSKGQPCFRASPLTQRYGWGVHYDSQGRMALVGMETEAYRSFAARDDLVVKAAMKTRR